jgi:hypothetical protein
MGPVDNVFSMRAMLEDPGGDVNVLPLDPGLHSLFLCLASPFVAIVQSGQRPTEPARMHCNQLSRLQNSGLHKDGVGEGMKGLTEKARSNALVN